MTFQAGKSLIVNNIMFISLIFVSTVMMKRIGMELIVMLALLSIQTALNATKMVQYVLYVKKELISLMVNVLFPKTSTVHYSTTMISVLDARKAGICSGIHENVFKILNLTLMTMNSYLIKRC